MICASCGTEIPDDSTACPSCGGDPSGSTPTVVAEPTVSSSVTKTIDYSKLNKAQYKDAKAAYKAARRAAGKSRVLLTLFCIVLALILAGGGFLATWFYLNPQINDLTSNNKDLLEQIDKLTAEKDALAQKLAEYEKNEKNTETSKGNQLIGSWKVSSFESTTENFACFGGKAKQASVRINIKSIDDSTGTIVADLAVVYHGHNRSKLKSNADSSSDDVVLDFSNIEGEYVDGAFTFELPVDSKYGNNSGIVVSGLLSSGNNSNSSFGTSSNSTLQLSVASYYQSLTNAITDTYLMKN